MNRYVIKSTYLTGPHKGRSYFLIKGGKGWYVTDHPDELSSADCYKTESICRSVCNKLSANNIVEYRLENKQRERQAEKGQTISVSRIYELMSYEPYEVRTVHPAAEGGI